MRTHGTIVAACGLLLLAGCRCDGPGGAPAATLINGAGATFPYPIYSKWFDKYRKVDENAKFNYQSIGSGGGIRQITARTVDFGASDAPMKDEALEKAPAELLHLPAVLGGVVATCNIPGFDRKINFSQRAIAGIFLGEITRWNDPLLAVDNPEYELPDEPIIVIHRSDGSGTTFIWTDFLSAISTEWASEVGKGKSVKWPVGLGGKGNEGVAGLVKQMPHSIGYVELGYALHNKLQYGRVENATGDFVDCTPRSVSLAAGAAAANMPPDFRVSVVNRGGAGVYPVASFTWLLVYRDQEDAVKGQAMVDFLHWMLDEGQKYAAGLGYAPLAPEVIEMEKATIKKIRIRGL